MNADKRRFRHEDITRRIIGVFFEVYNEMGYGFLESVYREAMVIALESNGLRVEKEFGLEARFRGQVVGMFKADLLVNGCVIVELKALKRLAFSNDRKGGSAREQIHHRTQGSGTYQSSICVHLR